MYYTKKYFNLLLIPIFLITFHACREEIPLELNNQEFSRLTVEGRITNQQKQHFVKLSKTISYLENEQVPPVSGAEVSIMEKSTGKIHFLAEVDTMPGYYFTDTIQGKISETYILTVKTDGEIYEASSFLENVAQLDSIGYAYKLEEFFGYQYGYYTLNISAQEPEPKGHNYMFYIYMNDTIVNPWIDNTEYSDDQLLNGKYLTNLDIYFLEQEYVTLDSNHIIIEMYSISKDELNFNMAFELETNFGGSIFSGPPANIPSNIINVSGGYDGVGFFGASAVSYQEMIMPKMHADSTNREDFSPRPR